MNNDMACIGILAGCYFSIIAFAIGHKMGLNQANRWWHQELKQMTEENNRR